MQEFGQFKATNRLSSIQNLGVRRTTHTLLPAVRSSMRHRRIDLPAKTAFSDALIAYAFPRRLLARRLLTLPGIMGNSHNQTRCHALRSCDPAKESLSCLSAGSPKRPHSSPRLPAGCCESGSVTCTLGNAKVNSGRRQKAADSLARSQMYVHTLLVMPIGCFDSWKGEIFAVSC
jgi:hypothetical protein